MECGEVFPTGNVGRCIERRSYPRGSRGKISNHLEHIMTVGPLMKQYLETKKKPTFLLGGVERWWISRTIDSDRPTNILHPSEIIKSNWCIRESWFLLRGAEKKKEPIGFRLRNIFETGHDIHNKWQRWLGDMDLLLGWWECDYCQSSWWGKKTQHPSKNACFRPRVIYKEVSIRNDDMLISGHADGWLTWEDDKNPDMLLEIKSIGTGTIRVGGGRMKESLEASFSLISAPFPDPVRLASLYVHSLNLMYDKGFVEEKPPAYILFIYECKADQAVKEFRVEYNQEWIDNVLDRIEDLKYHKSSPPECSTGSSACPCKAFG